MYKFCPDCGTLIRPQEGGDYREFANAEDCKIIPADVIEEWRAGKTLPLDEFFKELEEEGEEDGGKRMGIRDEIEKLETHRHPYQRGYLTTDEFLRKSDVLSILDEHLGECVGDGTIKPLPSATMYSLDDLIFQGKWKEKLGPGDHISIYVRRKDGTP